jgi:hypothetical protein
MPRVRTRMMYDLLEERSLTIRCLLRCILHYRLHCVHHSCRVSQSSTADTSVTLHLLLPLTLSRFHACLLTLLSDSPDSSAPYDYNALMIGVTLLSFGIGNIVGSIAGGQWSDISLRRQKEARGGVMVPEVSHPRCGR